MSEDISNLVLSNLEVKLKTVFPTLTYQTLLWVYPRYGNFHKIHCISVGNTERKEDGSKAVGAP